MLASVYLNVLSEYPFRKNSTRIGISISGASASDKLNVRIRRRLRENETVGLAAQSGGSPVRRNFSVQFLTEFSTCSFIAK